MHILKRLAAIGFDRRPVGDIVATFIKPYRDFCNLSAICNYVVAESQAIHGTGVLLFVVFSGTCKTEKDSSSYCNLVNFSLVIPFALSLFDILVKLMYLHFISFICLFCL